MDTYNKEGESDTDHGINQKQKQIQEASSKLQQLDDEYESNLKQFYSMKAEEFVLNLQFENWKQLYLKQEAEFRTKQEAARVVRTIFWKDREEFCAASSNFIKEFSLEATLAQMGRAAGQEEHNLTLTPANPVEKVPDMSPLTLRQVDLELEEEELRVKEAELNQMDQELAPDEETIRRLQAAVNNSTACVDELEQQINTLENKPSLDDSVKSILKRPSFVRNEIDQKQVRFDSQVNCRQIQPN